MDNGGSLILCRYDSLLETVVKDVCKHHLLTQHCSPLTPNQVYYQVPQLYMGIRRGQFKGLTLGLLVWAPWSSLILSFVRTYHIIHAFWSMASGLWGLGWHHSCTCLYSQLQSQCTCQTSVWKSGYASISACTTVLKYWGCNLCRSAFVQSYYISVQFCILEKEWQSKIWWASKVGTRGYFISVFYKCDVFVH